MSSFAVSLDRLLLHLASLPSSSPPHLQHLAIRLQRAYAQLHAAGTPAPAELFVRIRGRLEELAEGVDEARSAGVDPGTSLSWDMLEDDTREVLRDVDELLARSSGGRTPASVGHSRTPSVDLPRRVPSTQPPSASADTPGADLDAFLSSTSASRPPATANGISPVASACAHALSEAYSLYLLATSPSSVLPPGETLRSVFRSTPVPNDAPAEDDSLEARISTQLHQAFFDSFAATFSPSSPAPPTSDEAQRVAWARLSQDLLDAVTLLIPSRLKTASGVPLRAHLAAALRAPTEEGSPFDARAALEGVREAVDALGRVCAPARDEAVRALLADISSALASAAPASALVPHVRRVLELAREMDADMRRFKRGAARELAQEEDLRAVVREEAGARERKLVEEWCGGEEGVRRQTREWCARVLGRPTPDEGATAPLAKVDVATALVDGLFADAPVALPPFSSTPISDDAPSPSANLLPPILLIPSPALFALQNRLQALTILACLLSLSPSGTAAPERLWAILEAELAPATPAAPFAPSAATPDGTAHEPTRLAHLADELLPRPPAPPLPAEDEARLRSAVDRLLRYEDPVWRLLKGRLCAAVGDAVVRAVEGAGAGERERGEVPSELRTGRARGPPTSTGRGAPAPLPKRRVELVVPKGFDRAPLLGEKLREAVEARLVGEVWSWVESVWGGVLGWREATSQEGV
ncbi:hypothetical protein JCM10450v2_005550 [Rhodotorula kratochvilovae]